MKNKFKDAHRDAAGEMRGGGRYETGGTRHTVPLLGSICYGGCGWVTGKRGPSLRLTAFVLNGGKLD